MSANVYVLKRDKANGYYQNDMRCECIGEFSGWDAHDFVMGVVKTYFNAEGSAILRSYEDMGTVLKDMEEYHVRMREQYAFFEIEGIKFAHLVSHIYDFYHRVEEPFFKALVSSKEYSRWSRENDYPGQKQDLKEQIAEFKKVIPTLDFEKNYYYIVESI